MNIKYYFYCVIFLANGLAFASETDNGVVVLLDRAPLYFEQLGVREKQAAFDRYNRDKQNRRSNSPEHRDKTRLWRATRLSAMNTEGYIAAEEREVGGRYPPFEYSLEDLAPDLGYKPMSLDGTPFEGIPTAVWGAPEQGGGIHSVIYQFDFPVVGKVYMTEVSYSTSPTTAFSAIVEPFGNIRVQGKPATLYVYKAESGKGYSKAEAAIDGRILTLTVHEPLEPGNEKLELFKDLVSHLN